MCFYFHETVTQLSLTRVKFKKIVFDFESNPAPLRSTTTLLRQFSHYRVGFVFKLLVNKKKQQRKLYFIPLLKLHISESVDEFCKLCKLRRC